MSVTFDEVIGFHREHNQEVYEEIRDNLGQLLPFVGEGLTKDVYGTWDETLLELGRKLADDTARAELEEMVRRGDPLGAAQHLEERRGEINLQQDLVRHFARRKLDERWDDVTSGAVWLLPLLFECPVLTTNLDEAIEVVYSHRDFAPFPTLDPTSPDLRGLATRLRSTPCVFKLHGTVSGGMMDYSRLVFTRRQYEERYEKSGEAREALRAFVDTRSMLFLGCSLGKGDATVRVLEDAAGPGTTHFAIVSCERGSQDQRVRELAAAHIRAILYEEGRPESLRIVLEELLKELDPDGYRELLAEARRPRELSAAEQQLAKGINAKLVNKRKNHPRFQLMQDSYDDKLLPKGERYKSKPIPNWGRIVKTAGGSEMPFSDFIRKSWGESEQNHLFITGRGGIGKTVALLTFATKEGFLPKGTPAVYIPLHELAQYADIRPQREIVDRYLASEFGEDEYAAIQRLSHAPWDGGPNVILLLDGHNEIPVDKVARVDEGICAWAERPGVQLVTTTRVPGRFGVASTRWLELRPLTEGEAKTYLEGFGRDNLAIPNEGDAIWRVLETPLMLRLYADVSGLPDILLEPYLRWARPSDSSGNLIWNYLQRELWRVVEQNDGSFTPATYAFALLLTMPYVCWRMESACEFTIDRDTLAGYVRDACRRWSEGHRPRGFMDVEEDLGSFVNDVGGREFASLLRRVLAEETGLLSWNGDGYSLVHQSLRDGLAAVHLRNAMEAAEAEIPPELGKPISEYVKNLLADLCSTEVRENNPLLRLWEASRTRDQGRKGLADPTVTHNLLRIIHKRFDGDLSMLDWSGMDLRGESLHPYKKGLKVLLSTNPIHFYKAKVNMECFRPPLSRSLTTSTCLSPDDIYISDTYADGNVHAWDPGTGRRLHGIMARVGGRAVSICFSQNGHRLAYLLSDHTIRLCDAMANTIAVKSLDKATGNMRAISLTPNQSLIAIEVCGSTIRLWDVLNGTCLNKSLKHCNDPISSICLSNDNRLIAGGCTDGVVRLWSLDTGVLERELKPYGDNHSVTSVCFSPNSNLLAACYDSVVRIWDPSVGHQIGKSIGRSGDRASALSFSPDGSVLAIGYWDGSIRLWSVAQIKRTKTLPRCHTQRITTVCFSPDSTFIASGSDDGFIQLLRKPFAENHPHSSLSIRPLFSIDLTNLDLRCAVVDNKHDRETLQQNGVKLK